MNFRTAALAAFATASALAAGYSFVFSQRSLDNLAEVDKPLRKLANCALNASPVDFIVVDGSRTAEEHKINVENGKSWTKRSRHQDGKAIDVAAYVGGTVSYEPKYYFIISGAFYYCSEKHNIPIIAGGEWKVRDFMHIELDRNKYP